MSNVTLEESKVTRLMRHAIVHELHFPPGLPVDMMQQIVRALAQKARQGDVSAIKD
jgi:hypothetical protein